MRIISPAELASLKGIRFSNPHRLELEALGKFPRRVKLRRSPIRLPRGRA